MIMCGSIAIGNRKKGLFSYRRVPIDDFVYPDTAIARISIPYRCSGPKKRADRNLCWPENSHETGTANRNPNRKNTNSSICRITLTLTLYFKYYYKIPGGVVAGSASASSLCHPFCEINVQEVPIPTYVISRVPCCYWTSHKIKVGATQKGR